MIEIYCIDPQMVATLWPRVKGKFAQVYRDYPSDSSIEATERDVLAGKQLLWLGVDGVAIMAGATTTLVKVPNRKKICVITCAYGEGLRLWKKFMPQVEAYARAEKCATLRVAGRKGWSRVLRDFRQPWIVLDKDLT